jgi:hypothetical protein
MLIQLTERVTGPVRRIRSAIRGMVVTGERDVKRLDRIFERWGKTVRSVGRAIGTSIRWGALAAAAGAGTLLSAIVLTSSKFEQFQVILEGTEGSAKAARKAMDWVMNFAKTTPYEVDQVMDSFVRLRAYGIDPTDGTLRSLGDAASGMGKDLMSAVEMIADAQTGEFERMKEFGVKASAQGSKVTLSFTKNGKDMKVTADKSAASIRKAVLSIFDQRFAGMMDRQSKTVAGLWSNLKDQLTNFELDVGNAGFFDYIKGQLQRMLDWVNKLAKNGQLQKWAKQVSAKLVELAEKMKTVDWASIARGLLSIAKALVAIVKFAGWIERVFGLVNVGIVLIVAKIAFSLYGLAAALGVVTIAGAPLWAVVAVIALIAAGAFLVWKNWDKITAFFQRTWASLKAVFSRGAANLWAALPWWLQKIFQGVAFAINFQTSGIISAARAVGNWFSGGASKPQGAPAGRTQPRGAPLRGQSIPPLFRKTSAEVGGRLDIRLRTDRGTDARVTRLESNNRRVPINVSRGPLVTA